ncbi:carbohydrate ABC transporter permease [Alicyclobacillus sp. SO9]|uniref:carbohydrate ABC transporter permease n=1 Tax=Alicyclobacillus sp. SO9 TaxID=2665646 RepID=UPI001E4FF5FD|nr:sugar ABC transporter permease [Alicyclobacillus sp. SO9]
MKSEKSAWGFLLPFMLLFVVFLIGPLIYAFYISLFVQRMGVLHFIGFHNYIIALHNGAFWVSILRVLYYGVLQAILMIGLAIVLALLLDTPYARGKAFFRLVYFLPYAVPGVLAAILWGFMYSTRIDPILSAIHFKPLSSGVLLYSILNITVWEWVGYNMTIYIASLAGQNRDLFEAARIDGCGEWKLAWNVKLPLLQPTIVMTVLLSMIGSVQLFNEPFILESLTAISPNFTPNLAIFNMAIGVSNEPYGATLAVLLGVISIILSFLALFILRMVGRIQGGNSRPAQT